MLLILLSRLMTTAQLCQCSGVPTKYVERREGSTSNLAKFISEVT